MAEAVGVAPEGEWTPTAAGEAGAAFSEQDERAVEEGPRGLGYLE